MPTTPERAAYGRAWREQNKAQFKAKQAEWYARNREAKRLKYQSDESLRKRHRDSNKVRYHHRIANEPGYRELLRLKAYKRRIQQKYGISFERYVAILEAQDGRCAICRRLPQELSGKMKLVVDHCHQTQDVRGILCNDCNVGIARFSDDPQRLRAASEYLHAKTRTEMHKMQLVG